MFWSLALIASIFLATATPLTRAAVAAHDASESELATVYDPVGWHGKVITVSAHSPRAYLFKNFLTPEECDYLIDLAEEELEDATVVEGTTGESVKSEVRTSTAMSFSRGQDEIISRVEKRIAAVSHIPVGHGEPLQVLKYINGQKYDAHHDYFHDDVNPARERVSGAEWSDCANNKLSVKTEKGDALLFFSLNVDGTKDPRSIHASCPTTVGQKYSLTKWMRVYPTDGGCLNNHESCVAWAERGECNANQQYMHANCREACGVCSYEW